MPGKPMTYRVMYCDFDKFETLLAQMAEKMFVLHSFQLYMDDRPIRGHSNLVRAVMAVFIENLKSGSVPDAD